MRQKSSLGKAQFVGYVIVLLIFATAVGAFLLVDGRRRLAEEQRASDRRFITFEEENIKNKVRSAINCIIFLQGQTTAFMQKELKARVDEACAIAWHLYQQNKERMSRKELESMVREALRPIRYNDGRGYFFATGLDGVEMLNADRPQMEGRDLSDLLDSEGQYVIRDMIAIAKEKEAGFYYYTWTKPGLEGNAHPKLAYVRLFEPLGWIIGTGEYVDDAERDIQEQAIRLIGGMSENKDVYNFIISEQGVLLLHPDPRYFGSNQWDYRDSRGTPVIQGLIAQAQKPGGGFLWYLWKKVGQDTETGKLSYAVYYAPWKWVVGTGVFMDQMEAARRELADRFESKVRSDFISLALFLLLAVAAALLFAGIYSRRAQREVNSLLGFFRKSEGSFPSIDGSAFSFLEFSEIAGAANRMNAERHKAVSALSEKERMMNLLFSNLPGMAYRCGPPPYWTLEFASEGCRELLGLAPEELTGKNPQSFSRFVHPDDCPRITGEVDAAIAQGKAFLLEYRIRDAQGRERWVWEAGHDVRGPDGKLEALEGFITDITDAMKMRLALHDSEQRFRDLADLLPGGIFEMDLSGRLSYVNKGALEMFGYSEADFGQGLFALSIMANGDRERAARRIGAVLTGASLPAPSEYLCRKKDGTEFSAIIHTSVIVRDGKISGLRGVALDVTLLKEAQKAREISDTRFRAVFDSARDGIFLKDTLGRFQLINPALQEMMARPESDFKEKSPEEVFGGDTAARIKDEDRNVLGGQDVAVEHDLTIMGEKKTFHVLKVPMRGRDGSVIGILGIARDVTRQKKLESDLRQAQKMDALGRLAGGIAHDFNNILAAILGYAELSSLDESSSPVLKSSLDHMVSAAKRGKELVRQILLFSRREDIRKEPVSIKDVVLETGNMLRATLPASIRMDLDIRSKNSVMGSSVQIQQVLVNLCTNAAKAMSETGGRLQVGLYDEVLDSDAAARHPGARPGPYVRLTVTDSGPGIAPEIKECIFEPFFTTGKPGQGSGMGLSVVHGIVSSHGGFITVYSEPSRGATFNVFFPSAGEPRKTVEGREGDTPQLQRRYQGTVLFVDDEPALVGLGERLLVRLGFRVVCFTESPKALEAFSTAPDSFDLLITDQTMPDMTGSELAEAVLALRPEMPIILCTGYSETMSEDRALSAGISAFVMKPATLKGFSEAVERALAGKGNAEQGEGGN
ncbi:MAG: cache domain-containing protein [Thermodesulfobacteriota bacterium]